MICKKATLHAQGIFFCTFLYRCFARLHVYNVKLPSYTFNGVNVAFFSLPPIFTLVATSISQFLTVATIFSCCSSNKKRLHFFISCCGCLSFFFSLSFAGLSPIFSFSLSFSFSIFQICGHEN